MPIRSPGGREVAVLPVMLDVAGRLVVVVGGGPVGRRKAAAARDAGATVRIVDPRIDGLAERLTTATHHDPPQARRLQPAGLLPVPEPYRPSHLDGAALVFACATPEVNARVTADAKARGVWVCSASDPETGDFTLPAVVRRGGLTLAVGTGGASPGLARRVKEKLATDFDETFGEWVSLLEVIRVEVLAAVPDPARRRALLDGFADWGWLERLRADGAEVVLAAMRAAVS